ncbi:MAG: hypothetical protein ACXADB_11860, partial [Candidatus Hermodarchaeia archaeon]
WEVKMRERTRIPLIRVSSKGDRQISEEKIYERERKPRKILKKCVVCGLKCTATDYSNNFGDKIRVYECGDCGHMETKRVLTRKKPKIVETPVILKELAELEARAINLVTASQSP